MKKSVEFFKSPLFFPVAVLLVLYGYWLLFIPTKTFFSNLDLRLGILCLATYFTITVFHRILISNERLFFIPFIIAAPISLGGLFYGALYLFLMFTFDFYEYRPVFLSLLGILAIVVLTYKKLVSQNQPQAIFFLITTPIFVLAVFNFIIFSPKIWKTDQLGEYKYYIVEEIWDYPHSDTDFIKCKKLSFQCNYLSGIRFARPEIIVDEQNNEVSVIDARGLVYTDGLNPRRYTGHEGGQLGSNLYYLSEICHNFNFNQQGDCESYTLIPYECNIDNKSCDPLPIKFEGDFDFYPLWKTDDANNEISLLYADNDNDVLIFTYGEHPRCFINECEILKQE